MKSNVIKEAYAVIAHVEGREAPANPLLGWAPADLYFVPDESRDTLDRAGILTVADLLKRTPLDLAAAGADPRSIRTIREGLRQVGFSLARRKGPPPPSHAALAAPLAGLLAPPSKRLLNVLAAAGIVTVADLLKRSAEELLEVRGIGATLLDYLEEGLRGYGLALATSADRASAA